VNPGRISLVVLATVVIFAAGVVTGGLLVRKTNRLQPGAIAQPFWGRFEMVRRAVDEMDRRQGLTSEQRVRIDQIIRDSQELIADYFSILEPDAQQIFRRMRENIRDQLTPEQRRQYEELMKRRWSGPGDRRFQDRFRDGPARPGGPPPNDGNWPPPQRNDSLRPLPPPPNVPADPR
jgi:hypothetical protein